MKQMTKAKTDMNMEYLMNYTTLRVQKDTRARLLRYIAKRMTEEEGKRITVDDALMELLDRAGVP
jgi:hypothetical protein